MDGDWFQKYVDLSESVRDLFEMLDAVEVSDNGTPFHPTTIGTCRAMNIQKLSECLTVMREQIGLPQPKPLYDYR